MKNTNLDERQEQILLRIERNCYWIVFWGLVAVMLLQIVLYGFDLGRLAGEWFVIMAVCVYQICASIKNGIWDRRLKPNAKTNAILSLIAAVVFGAVTAVGICRRFEAESLDYFISFGGTALVTFVLCFAALTFTARSVRRKTERLEAEEPEE